MTIRLDGLYDIIVELEEKIEDAKLKCHSVEMNAITLDNVYKMMINFEKVYDKISNEAEVPLKSISFNFPIYKDGQEVQGFLWDKGNTVETVVLLKRV